MSCGLNWEPWLRAQHIGFIRQSSCLSWGGKACQNLHRHLQSFVFYSLCSPRVPTGHRRAVLGSWDCAQRDPLSVSSSLRPAVQALLWEELVFSGSVTTGDTLTFLSVCPQGRQLQPPVFPIIKGYFQWDAMVKLAVRARLAKSKASLACWSLSRATVQQSSLDKHCCCSVLSVSPFLISDPRKKFLCSLLTRDR